jgi:chaperonin GroEL (HSP60 family)
VQKGKYIDMNKDQIIDPLKVVQTPVVDASGVASLLMTNKACVVDAPEEDKITGPDGGMGDMGGFQVDFKKYLKINK